MSRHVDTLPTPAHVEPKKLIVLSPPRSGTQGLYFALKELGFKPYHMAEIMRTGGPDHLRMMIDAFDGELGENKRYTRADFDKWYADYDVIIEFAAMSITSHLEAYPDAKYLMVTRSPEKWATSLENTVFEQHEALDSFPVNVFRSLEPRLRLMGEFSRKYVMRVTGGYGRSAEGRKNTIRYYNEYVETVKRLVPPEQLEIIRLEDGYGWEAICPYLGLPIPDRPWPRINNTEEFRAMSKPMMKKVVMAGAATMAALATPVIGSLWALQTGRWTLPFSLVWKK